VLDAFLVALADDLEPTLATRKAAESAELARARLAAGRPLSWNDWAALAQLEVGKAMRDAAAAVAAVAGRYLEHPRLHVDLGRAIDLAFGLAGRTLAIYAEQKRALGVVDFTDQLVLALELLARPAVREQLRRLGLVLVDEFQDTIRCSSPFLAGGARPAERLGGRSEAGDLRLPRRRPVAHGRGDRYDHREHCDPCDHCDHCALQSPRSVRAAAAKSETLSTSYRSRPPLVALTSALRPGLLDLGCRKPGALRSVEGTESPRAPSSSCLERWVLGRGARRRHPRARGGRGEPSDPTVRVRDLSGATRRCGWGRRGLCRKNQSCLALAAELGRRGIRSALPRTGLLDPRTGGTRRARPLGRAARRPCGGGPRAARRLSADGEAWLRGAGRTAGVAFERPGCAGRAARRATWADRSGARIAIVVDLRGSASPGAKRERLANLDALRAATVAAPRFAAEGQPRRSDCSPTR
jgi:hypothetical protein